MKKLILAALFGLGAQTASAASIDLTGLGYVTYGDANSYSLAVANFYTCGKEMGKGCPYSINGSPGLTDVYIKVLEGPGGHLANDSNGIDDAFRSINNDLYFTTGTASEPDPKFTGDKTGTWDATLGALNTKLDLVNNLMTFFFVNNEPNADQGAAQNLAVWSRITLTDLAGSTTYGIWDLTNDTRTAAQRLANSPTAPGYGPPPIGGGVPYGDVTQYTTENKAPQKTDFVMSGGQVCIDKTSKAIVDCSTAKAGTFDTINHNLGENQAPYAVVVPELDALIQSLIIQGKNLDDYVMHVDLRYGCAPPFTIVSKGKDTCAEGGTAVSQDNNFEQVFIGTRLASRQEVPEPGSLLLLGLGMFGIVASRKFARR